MLQGNGDQTIAPGPESFHILVVDDEDRVRRILCELIASEGYQVTGVSGAPEALAFIDKNSVDLVLTDLMMPEMNGWQLLEAIKEHYSYLKVVVITGFISEEGEALLTSRQADGYLVKPIDRERMQTLFKALLFAHNLGRPAEIVAVDDDTRILEMIDESLNKRGLNVTCFTRAGEAFRYIREHKPDLAILDVILPDMNGLDVGEMIRADTDIGNMPIIIITADPSLQNVKRALQLDINGFVTKPFTPNEMVERVLSALRQVGG